MLSGEMLPVFGKLSTVINNDATATVEICAVGRVSLRRECPSGRGRPEKRITPIEKSSVQLQTRQLKLELQRQVHST